MDENKMNESLYTMIHAALMEMASDRPNLKTPQVSETLMNLLKARHLLEEEMDGGTSQAGYSRNGQWTASGGYARNAYDSGTSNGIRRNRAYRNYSQASADPTFDEMMALADPRQRAVLEEMRAQY